MSGGVARPRRRIHLQRRGAAAPPAPRHSNGPPISRYPNPPFYPENLFGVVAQVAAERGGDLFDSCRGFGGNHNFLFEVVRRLRQRSPRWGLNWKRGNIGDMSEDVVTYHWGEGEPSEGSTRVYIIDVISGHCGNRPGPNWDDVTARTYGSPNFTVGRWTIQPLH